MKFFWGIDMTKLKAAFGRAGQWIAAHKKAAVALLLVAAIAAGVLVWRQRSRPGCPPRPTWAGRAMCAPSRCKKGTLDDSISASGTVESDDVSNVTTDLKYTVKTVNVQVGDSVNAGDVICTLDTADLEKSIAKMKESLAEAKGESAQKLPERAGRTHRGTGKRDRGLRLEGGQKSARDSAKERYESAAAQVAAYQSTYESANADLLTKLNAMQKADADVAAYDAKEKELAAADPTLTGDSLKAAVGSGYRDHPGNCRGSTDPSEERLQSSRGSTWHGRDQPAHRQIRHQSRRAAVFF